MIFLICLATLSLIATIIFLRKIEQARVDSPTFRVTDLPMTAPLPSVTVVIPVYNEVINVADCIAATLQATDRPATEFQVWVVDDQSTDDTLTIAQTIADPRLKVIPGQARPEGETWVGKNWACAQVTAHIQTDYILFIDADVRLSVGSIDRALAFAVNRQTDLLSAWVTIDCGCWAEWECQPIIASLFAVAFEFPRINDPADPLVMAMGPFMLFRRSAYEAIGGHRAVAAAVVEDVELARRTQQAGLKYWYGLGLDLATLRMYRNLPGLWEGWTKNWHQPAHQSWQPTLYSAFVVFLLYAAPSVVGLGSLLKLGSGDAGWEPKILLLIALCQLLIHYWTRRRMQPLSHIPTTYWWLSSVGGWIVAAIPIVSLIKTETGWGWTWRGRSLKPISN